MTRNMVGILMIIMFALALGAGVVAGKLSSRLPAAPAAEGTLTEELQLSPDQHQAMQKIWEGVQQTSQDCIKQARAAQREQDDAVRAMLTPEQQSKYAQLAEQAAAKVGALDARRQAAFKDAVEQTSKLLDEKQRKVYQQIIRDRIGDRQGLLPNQSSSILEISGQRAKVAVE